MANHTDNLVIGRGKVYFARFAEGTFNPMGERYVGNTPEFNLTIEEEKLDHFSSDEGIREKNASISLETTRSGTLLMDDVNVENLALFFFGAASTIVDAGGSVSNEVISAVEKGLYYQLGVTVNAPTGARNIDAGTDFVVQNDDTVPTTYALTTDYELDATTGRLYIVPTGTITDGTNLVIDYTRLAHSRDRVVSGSSAVTGTLRFIAFNPIGEQQDFFMPYVTISPNGDFSLKTEEWQEIPYTIEVLKLSGKEAIYIDGRPYTP